jgi:hypothetical protein
MPWAINAAAKHWKVTEGTQDFAFRHNISPIPQIIRAFLPQHSGRAALDEARQSLNFQWMIDNTQPTLR